MTRLEEEAAALEAQAAQLEARAAELAAEARARRRAAAALRQASTLPKRPQQGKVSTGDMNLSTESRVKKNLAIARAKVSARDPFAAALREHGYTLRSWAEHIGVPRSTVAAWRAKTPHGRPVPAAFAAMAERDLGLPATSATWPNGIR